MASSTIKNINIPVENPTGMINVVSDTYNANFTSVVYRRYGKVVQLRLDFESRREISQGAKIGLGTMTGALPNITTLVPTFRQDGGLQGGTVKLPTSQGGGIEFWTLTTIPNGVWFTISVTYITN